MWKGIWSLGAAAALLGACTTSIPVPERNAAVTQPIHGVLAEGYVGLGARNAGVVDWRDAAYFNRRAGLAALGRSVPPQDPYMRYLPAAELVEVMDAYERLRRAINLGAREVDPENAGEAQVKYDCWIEELEEGSRDAAACRSDYFSAIEAVEAALNRNPMAGGSTVAVLTPADAVDGEHRH